MAVDTGTHPIPSSDAEVADRNIKDVDRLVNTNADVVNRAGNTLKSLPKILDEVQVAADDFVAVSGGIVVFQTFALLDAYTPTTQQETGSFKVTNDGDTSLNGYYSWVVGTTYTKDADLVLNDIDPTNTSDGVSGAAVDKAIQAVDDSVLNKYSLSRQNFFRVDTDGVSIFNGASFALEVVPQRVKVTAGSADQGIQYGDDLIDGNDYIAIVDFEAGTAGAQLLRNWNNTIINPLVDGWNTIQFTAGTAGGFGNDIVVAAIGAGDFYINSIHVYEVISRVDVDTFYVTPAQEYDLYYNDFEGVGDLKDYDTFGYGGTSIIANGYLEVAPTTNGQLFILGTNTTIEEGEWIYVEVDIEIVDTAVEFLAYWDNSGGTSTTISTNGVHRFILRGDGSRTGTTALQHLIFVSVEPTGGTIRIKDIKTRLTSVIDANFQDEVNISETNTLDVDDGTAFGFPVSLSTFSSKSAIKGAVMVGTECSIDNNPLFGGAFSEPSVTVGNEAVAHCGRCTVIGFRATAHSVSGTSVGALTAAYNSHDISLGRGAHTLETISEPNILSLGGPDNKDIYPGSGVSSRWKEPGTGTIQSFDPTTFRITYHGYDAFDDVDATVIDVGGSAVNIAGGKGTGTGVGGSVYLQTATANASSNNNKNTLVDRIEIDTSSVTDESPMLLLINGSLRRVKLGAPDSGGTGLTALVIDNV